MPDGWRKVLDGDDAERKEMRLPQSTAAKLKARMGTIVKGLSKRDAAAPTSKQPVMGPLRERKVFTYADGYVLTLERAHPPWEGMNPKSTTATPCIDLKKGVDVEFGPTVMKEDIEGHRKDTVLEDNSTRLGEFDFESGNAGTSASLRIHVLRAGGFEVSRLRARIDDYATWWIGGTKATARAPINGPSTMMTSSTATDTDLSASLALRRLQSGWKANWTWATNYTGGSFCSCCPVCAPINQEAFDSFSMDCTTEL